MINLYITAFCNKNRHKNKNPKCALIIQRDNRNRIQGSFVISRKALPKDARVGDKISLVKG